MLLHRFLQLSVVIVTLLVFHYGKDKGTEHLSCICIAPQAAYRSCSGAFCVSDRAGVQPIGRRLSLHPDFDLLPDSHMRPGLPLIVSTPVIHGLLLSTHLPTPEGWKAELAWLFDL